MTLVINDLVINDLVINDLVINDSVTLTSTEGPWRSGHQHGTLAVHQDVPGDAGLGDVSDDVIMRSELGAKFT